MAGDGFLSWWVNPANGARLTDCVQEGLLTVVVSALAYLWVYNYPATAEFLSDEEREFIQFRLRNDNDSTREEKFSWSAVLDAFKDPKVWLYGLGFHTMSLPLYTLSLFLVSQSAITADLSNDIANNHQATRLHSRQGSTPLNPSLRRRLRLDYNRRYSLAKNPPPRSVYHGFFCPRLHWLHPPACSNIGGNGLRRDRSGRGRNLPCCRYSSLLAR